MADMMSLWYIIENVCAAEAASMTWQCPCKQGHASVNIQKNARNNITIKTMSEDVRTFSTLGQLILGTSIFDNF